MAEAARGLARWVVLHWCAMALLAISLASGLRLHASQRALDAPAPWEAYLPSGAVHQLHLLAACAWIAVLLGYACHLWQARRLGIARRNPTAALAHGLTRLLRYVLGASLLSGALLYASSPGLLGGNALAAHYTLAWLSVACVVAHALAHVLRGAWNALGPLLRPRLRPSALAQSALLLPLGLGAGWVAWTSGHSPVHTPLLALSIEPQALITLDGLATEAQWSKAPQATVSTTLPGPQPRQIEVRVQALRQGEVLYLLLRWPDAEASLQHLPLIKTANGWRVEHDGLLQHDERRHYEDKFALLWSDSDALVAGDSLRLGPAARSGVASAHIRRGQHATAAGQWVDLWQWKAVRSGPLGQLDDSHIGPAYPAVPGEMRDTAGYKSDPAWSGGYSENWQWLGDGHVIPKRLPKDPALLAPFQTAASAAQAWGLSWYDTRPYAAELDHYPLGTRMPSVLWIGMFEGDRGDVRAQAQWQQGQWSLEISRGLKAASPFDLDLHDGSYLWVAVFDHAQTRHSYHLRPLRLVLR